MKHLKTYEKCTKEEELIYDDCSDSWYWQITTKYPDILIAFDKIGLLDKSFYFLWDKDNHLIKDVLIFKTKYENGDINWSYASVGMQEPDYRKPAIFMGKVQITDKDYEKWKMKEQTKKYNI